MSTEYYIAKPDKKELYGLGKRLTYFHYINDECYGSEADYASYDCFHDFMIDIIDNNDYFMESLTEDTWGTIVKLLYEIYEFASEDKVFIVNDCSDTFKFDEYKEVGSIYDFFERSEAEIW